MGNTSTTEKKDESKEKSKEDALPKESENDKGANDKESKTPSPIVLLPETAPTPSCTECQTAHELYRSRSTHPYVIYQRAWRSLGSSGVGWIRRPCTQGHEDCEEMVQYSLGDRNPHAWIVWALFHGWGVKNRSITYFHYEPGHMHVQQVVTHS